MKFFFLFLLLTGLCWAAATTGAALGTRYHANTGGRVAMANAKRAGVGNLITSPAEWAANKAAIAAANAQLAGLEYHPAFHAPKPGSALIHGRMEAANASMFNESYMNEPLTAYAVGYQDMEDLDALLEVLAPAVPVGRRFTYREFPNKEAFLSDGSADEDIRSMGGEFALVDPYTSTETEAKTENRGLRTIIDMDMEARPDWQEFHTARLLARLKRNAIRRAIAGLSTAATNSNKTWDTSSGKDPDADVRADLVTAATAAGVRPTHVVYGDTSWEKRSLSHRAQTSAGGFASSGLTEEQVAAMMRVQKVLAVRARYSDGSSLSELVGNLVLMYTAVGQSVSDPSNIKRFTSEVDGGGLYKVYLRQVATKLWEIAVECYDKVAITSTLGIRKFTVS